MSRLLDRLIEEEYIQQLGPVIDISNVAEYYYNGTSQDYWDICKDFPNCAPPFKYFWTEYKFPNSCTTRSGAVPMPGNNRNGTAWSFYQHVDEIPLNGQYDATVSMLNHSASVKWVGIGYSFLQSGNEIIRGAVDYGIAIGADGIPIRHTALFDKTRVKEGNPGLHQMMATWHPDLLAISFMHCKNVKQTIDCKPPGRNATSIRWSSTTRLKSNHSKRF
jgi:hypothetical protein